MNINANPIGQDRYASCITINFISRSREAERLWPLEGGGRRPLIGRGIISREREKSRSLHDRCSRLSFDERVDSFEV